MSTGEAWYYWGIAGTIISLAIWLGARIILFVCRRQMKGQLKEQYGLSTRQSDRGEE